MALKIKQNGEVKDLIIPACGVSVLDMEDNFGSSNLEEILQELGDSDSVYVSDETPDKDGVWITSDNTTNVSQENPTLVELKKYVDTNVTPKVDKNTNSISQLSNPNLLINGDFQVWQRGTSFPHKHGKYCVDRWQMYMDNAEGKITWSKTDDGIKALCTVANTDGLARIWYAMDSVDRKKLKGKQITYTIKYKSNVNKAYLLTYVGYYVLPKSDTWNTISFTETYENKNQWFTGVQIGDSNYSMALNEYIEIAYIKAELGTVATPFVSRPYGEELALCQRYYQVIKNGMALPLSYYWNNGNTRYMDFYVPLITSMRITPTFGLMNGTIIQIKNFETNSMETEFTTIGVLNGVEDNATYVNMRFSKVNGTLKMGEFHPAGGDAYLDSEIY